MRSIINLFQQPFYKTVLSDGIQVFMEFSLLETEVYILYYVRHLNNYNSTYKNEEKEKRIYYANRVAARNSHFCLACNLIRPLGSTHNFTQSGWLILFNPNHLSGQHKLGKSAKHFLFRRTTSFCTDVYRLLSNSSSSCMAPWGKQSNSWTPWLFFLDQGFPV